IEGIGGSPSGNYTPPTGQLIPPSLYANPESTVNSSISSAPTPVITSGAGEGGGVVIGGATGTTASVTATPATAAALTAAATTSGVVSAAPIFSTAATVATPTNTANILTPGQFAAGPGATTTPATIVSSGPLPVAQGTVLA